MSEAHWYGLSRLPGVGGATLQRLLERFGSAEAVFGASDSNLLQVPRVTKRTIAALRTLSLDKLQEELDSFSTEGINILSWEDSRYPDHLKHISSPPSILYVRGSLQTQDDPAIAIVGTRSPRSDSGFLAGIVARTLAEAGVTVISGLALGIDTSAHIGALEAATGRTFAVLGSGVNAIHPKENETLAKQITTRGALISELHPTVRARGSQLMARDRIVSGLSRAVLVVEAGLNSGSLDTAQQAKKQGRLLYAFPGSAGTDQLLQEGARRLEPDHIDYSGLIQSIQKPIKLRSQADNEMPRQLGLDL